MKSITPVREAYRIQFRSFTPFLLISFGMAWGILGLYIFLPELMETVFGQLTGNHPLFFLAVYAPAIAAFILVARNDGFTGSDLRVFILRSVFEIIRNTKFCISDNFFCKGDESVANQGYTGCQIL